MIELYRYECPLGHRNVRQREDGRWYCRTCARHCVVTDLKTGETA